MILNIRIRQSGGQRPPRQGGSQKPYMMCSGSSCLCGSGSLESIRPEPHKHEDPELKGGQAQLKVAVGSMPTWALIQDLELS